MNNTSHLLLKALSFAADRHRFQRRKDSIGTPYINHPINVALTLIEIGGEEDEELLAAAALHDTIEDTETTPEEIEIIFGRRVRNIVMEVTDDKNLSKEERKNLQIIQASKKSLDARKLKLADKICNVNDIIFHPPAGWSVDRKLDYLSWAEKVLQGLRGANPILENKLQQVIDEGRSLLETEGVLK